MSNLQENDINNIYYEFECEIWMRIDVKVV